MRVSKSGGKIINIPREMWNDWKWQSRNRIETLEELKKYINITQDEEEGIKECLKVLKMSISPYYLSLIDVNNPNDPIRRQSVPSIKELAVGDMEMIDPLNEDYDSKIKCIVHRYDDRVLFLVTNQCFMYCRHCTRRRLVGKSECVISRDEIDLGIEYIKSHSEVRDVLISGGDPLTLSDNNLEYILKKVREIEHVEVIRIGTRAPVVMPSRITKDLCDTLKKYHPIWINTHFNHPNEITEEAKEACSKLVDSGIPVGNQSVLLANINDCPNVMKNLVHRLVKARIRPYYLYQCDLVCGLEHFRTSITKGIEIIEALRGHTSGFAIPDYVIDAPGGGGKIPILPNYVISQSSEKIIFRNFEGQITTYHEPRNYKESCSCESCKI